MSGRERTIKTSPARLWFCALLIIGGAAILRLSYNANTIVVDPIRADAAYYVIYANNLLDYATFSKDRAMPPTPDAFWAPGYPVFLAYIIKATEILARNTYHAILFCQLLLGVATVLLAFLLARSFLPAYWSLLPPFLVALSPHLVSTASYLLSETLLGFMILLSLYGLSTALTTQRRFHWLLAGTSFALCYLVNPVTAFLAPLLALATWVYNRPWTEGGQGIALPRWGLALLISPLIIAASLWSARAMVSVPADQPNAADRLRANLTVGLYSDYHEKWRASILQPEKNIVVPGAGVDESYGKFFAELQQRFYSDPLAMLGWYLVQKPVDLWSWDIKTGWGGIYIYRVEASLYKTSVAAIATYALMSSLHPWLLAAAVLGLGYLFSSANKSVIPLLLYTTLLYLSSVYVVTQAEARYSIPLRAELYLCASFFLWRTAQWLGRMKQASEQTRG